MTLATWKIEMQAAARSVMIATVNALSAPRPQFAWENEPYSPAAGTPFITESFRVDTTQLASIGRASGTIKHAATVALVFKYPAAKGTLAADTVVGLMMAAFKPGTRLERGGCSAFVTNVDPRPAIQEPNWLMVPLNIALLGHSNT